MTEGRIIKIDFYTSWVLEFEISVMDFWTFFVRKLNH
jgi:hypothetical protein